MGDARKESRYIDRSLPRLSKRHTLLLRQQLKSIPRLRKYPVPVYLVIGHLPPSFQSIFNTPLPQVPALVTDIPIASANII